MLNLFLLRFSLLLFLANWGYLAFYLGVEQRPKGSLIDGLGGSNAGDADVFVRGVEMLILETETCCGRNAYAGEIIPDAGRAGDFRCDREIVGASRVENRSSEGIVLGNVVWRPVQGRSNAGGRRIGPCLVDGCCRASQNGVRVRAVEIRCETDIDSDIASVGGDGWPISTVAAGDGQSWLGKSSLCRRQHCSTEPLNDLSRFGDRVRSDVTTAGVASMSMHADSCADNATASHDEMLGARISDHDTVCVSAWPAEKCFRSAEIPGVFVRVEQKRERSVEILSYRV